MAYGKLSEEPGVTVTSDGIVCVEGWPVYVTVNDKYEPTAFLEGEEMHDLVMLDGSGTLAHFAGVPDGAVLLAVARLAFRMGFEAGGGAALGGARYALDSISSGLPR